MALTYVKLKAYLDSRDVTHEQMQAMWDEQLKTNWKVKALAKAGMNWTDLIEPALDSLIKLAIKEKENGSTHRR